ncbi:PepSY-associated TM helix domain-containing protein, partial [Actinomadura adrarensis]
MSTIADQTPEEAAPAPKITVADRSLWPLLSRLHFYAAVLVAPFLVIAALTGLAYAFTPQLDRLIYADEMRVERVAGPLRPLSEQVRAARVTHPEGAVATVIPPTSEVQTTRVVLDVPDLEPKQRTVYVDPYTNRVAGALTTDFGSTPVTTWLSELHRCLHLGKVGALYSEMAASWLWVIAAAGLLMWLGRRHYRGSTRLHRIFWPDRSSRGLRRTRGRHAVLGIWLAVGLLLLSATGLTWTDHAGANFDKLQARFDSTAPKLNTAASGAHAGHQAGGAASQFDPAVHIDHALATARSAGLSGPLEITPPEKQGSSWQVAQADNTWPVRQDAVAIDPTGHRVTDRVDWAEHPTMAKLSTLGIQLHMGRLFGVPNQVGMAALALGLLTILFLGYRMWWQRRPTRTGHRRPMGRPPARGALRQV